MTLRVQTKIILLLSLLIILSIGGLFVLRYFEHNRAQLIFYDKIREKNILFDKLLKLNGTSHETITYDYSYWDEMVSFVKSGDLRWAHENIDVGLEIYKSHTAWIYRPDWTLVYSTNNVKDINIRDILVKKKVFDKYFSKSYFQHFFIDTSQGLAEIRSAPIQPSNDSMRETPAQGYFLVGRFWNQEHLDELSGLTESIVKIKPAVQRNISESDQREGVITITRALTDCTGAPLAYVYSKSDYNVLKEFNRLSNQQFFFFILFSLLMLLLIVSLFIFWVSKPLSLIFKGLYSEDPEIIGTLQGDRTEFGNLAVLITKFFENKKRMMEDIVERERMEEERKKLIKKLQSALTNVKTLSGLLPICALCKKIRDDKGYWTQIEAYLHDHSDADFTHSLCPECAKKSLDELYKLKKERP